MRGARKAANPVVSRAAEYRRILMDLSMLGIEEARLEGMAEAYFTRGGRWPKPPAKAPFTTILKDLERAHQRAHDLWDQGACTPFTLDVDFACKSRHHAVQAVAAAASAVCTEFALALERAETNWVDPERPDMDRDHLFDGLEYLFVEEEQSRRAHPQWQRRLTQKDVVFAMLVKEKERTLPKERRAEAPTLVRDGSLKAAYRRFKSELSARRSLRARAAKVR